GQEDHGTVFCITTNGVLTTLGYFSGTNGGLPYAGLIQARDGCLYGVTSSGSSQNAGNVFRLVLNSQMMPPVRVGSSWNVGFKGIPGTAYQIFRATNLSGPWTMLTNLTADLEGRGTCVDSA